MLENIGALAAQLNMAFGFGDLKALDDTAQKVTSGFLLFHEGYFKSDLNEDGQGALEYNIKLTLDICMPSHVNDSPAQRLAHLDLLDIQMRKVYKALKALGQVKNARADMGINLTSRNLDGIQLTCTLLPNAVSICQY